MQDFIHLDEWVRHAIIGLAQRGRIVWLRVVGKVSGNCTVEGSIRVPVCARVSRVCPGSPRCLFTVEGSGSSPGEQTALGGEG